VRRESPLSHSRLFPQRAEKENAKAAILAALQSTPFLLLFV
jgi:hypothetical protein